MSLIDSITHAYTGKQILAECIKQWKTHGADTAIVLLGHRGELVMKVRAMRVALSKERNKTGSGSYYGIATSEVFPWTHNCGYKGEAVLIRYEQKKGQRLSHVFATKVIGEKRAESNG